MIKYATTVVTEPDDDPLTVPDVKQHLGIAGFVTGHDQWIRRTIDAATSWFEDYTGRQLITATRDLHLDCFPAGRKPLLIPHSPVSSITSITYLRASDGASTAFTDFSLLAGHEPGTVIPTFGNTWPATRDIEQAATVRFVCGYGDLLDVPSAAKHALLLLIGDWFNNREDSTPVNLRQIPTGVTNLADQFRVGDEFTEYA